MAELRPLPLAALVRRMFRELDERDAVFDLPRRKFVTGADGRDLSVALHGHRAATPLGPAAGPQSQMAQNVVLSWLGGARVLELKTVQVDDELVIPRPCIDMQTVGYNVEWSQELKLEQSLEEYVKGMMLVELLAASGRLELAAGWRDTVYDMSVGYDLAGVRSPRVQAFLDGMLDCSDVVERLRRDLPPELGPLRDLDFPTRLSDTLTLSTFHGCPPDEIEAITTWLLEEKRLHAVVKLNPMLLGPERTRELLHERLGYTDVRVPDSAFERDTRWDQAVGFVERLGARADALGLGFGVKFTNTLIVENHRDFFPASEREMYLSGPPLHVLAMDLVRRFRATFGDRWPVSFSAGIDRRNFPDAVALGLVPITVCSDLLKPGGYARARGYFDELLGRMDAVGARDVDGFVLRAHGRAADDLAAAGATDQEAARCLGALEQGGDARAAAGEALFARWLAAARVANTDRYAARLPDDPRYAQAANARLPRKLGSHLELFDCVACDKCVPVCPNDANFAFEPAAAEVPIVHARAADAGWTFREDGVLRLEAKRQYANFADFCNDCGNCDVFCPEDGGPYLVKPRFFGTVADWRASAHLDGFAAERAGEALRLHARVDGRELLLERGPGAARYAGDGFDLRYDPADLRGTLAGRADTEVDLTWARVLELVLDAVYADAALTHARFALDAPAP